MIGHPLTAIGLSRPRSAPSEASAVGSGTGILQRNAQVLLLYVVLQARALVQVPALTRALTVEEFGALTLALWIAGSAGTLSLLGLQTGLFLNLVRLEAARTRAALASVLAIAVPLAGIVGLAATLVLTRGLGGPWLESARAPAIPIGVLIAASALREIAMVAPRARQDVGFFWTNSLWMHYGGFAIGWALALRQGPAGFLLGLAAGSLSGAAVALVHSLRRSEGPAAWDRDFLARVARSSAPVLPLALAHMSLQSLDYVFVSRFLGAAALAPYGLAYTLASPVLLLVAVVNFTLVPETVARHRRGGADLASFVERMLAWAWTGALVAVAGAIVIGPRVVEAIAGNRYRAAADLLPAIVASYSFFALAQVLHLVRSALVANVRYTATIAVACALVNAAGNFWLIPAYGLRGAAAMTLASFLLYYAGMRAALKPLLPEVHGERRPGLLMLGLAALPVLPLMDPSAGARAIAALGLVGLAVVTASRRRTRRAGGRPLP